MALRRRQERKPPSLVAAAKRLNVAARPGQRLTVKHAEWQSECWDYYDAVPEVKHSARFVGNSMAKLRMFPAVENPDDPDGPPVPLTAKAVQCPPEVVAAARAELTRLKSARGGQAEIQRQVAINFEVAGEGYIVGRAEHDEPVDPLHPEDGTVRVPESWEAHSISEVTEKDGKYVVTTGPTTDAEKYALTENDTIIRLWQRHPRWADQPDCALGGLLLECEALHTLALQVVGESLSKRNNGFLLVPNELVFSSPNKTEAEENDPDADPMMEALTETMQGPIADPSSPSSVQPTLVRGPADALKGFRHVSVSRTGDTIEERINGRVARLARGLDLPVEVVLGHQQTTFANAQQVDRDTFDDYLQPRAELMVDALTFGYYRPNLLANSAVPDEWAERIFLWYDESSLVTQPDPAESADAAHEKLTISDEAYRRYRGYAETDAPDDMELLRRTGLQRGILTGDLTLGLLQLIAKQVGIDLTPAVPAEVPVDSTGAPQPVDGAGDSGPSAPADPAPADPVDPNDAGDAPGDAAPNSWSGDHVRALAAAIADGVLIADDETRRVAIAALAAAGSRHAPNNYGKRLLAIDQQVRAQLLVAVDAAMTRALDRAASRLVSKAPRLGVDRKLLANVAKADVARTLGPSLVAAAGDNLLDGAWDDLEQQFRAWAAQAQADAIDLASRIASGFSTAEREALQLRQAQSVDEAWSWMRGSLDSLAHARLFDPTPGAPDLGEIDAVVNVPAGLIRQAMARAGGATGLVTDGRDAWVALYPDGTPPGMIATGEDIFSTLAANGVDREGFVWVYGPASRSRPFEPHLELDGTTFVNFDDPVLANSSGWPDDAFYFPGDHSGCLCDYEPVLLAPDE